MLKTFQEFRSEISIIDLALANGYEIDKAKGQKWPVLYHSSLNERIIIANPKSSSNQGYWNPENDSDKGTLIDFIRNRLGVLFPNDTSKSEIVNINNFLYNWLKIDCNQKQPLFIHRNETKKIQNEFSSSCLQPLTNIEYLKSRGLSVQTIHSTEFKDRIFNTELNGFCSTAFPYYDHHSEIIGIEVRNKNFKHNVEGSNKSIGVWLSNMPQVLKHIVLCESAIDAISYFQLKNPTQTLYVSFGGSISNGQIETVKAIKNMATIANDFSYISAVDNDDTGHKYNEKFKEAFGTTDRIIIDKPVSKDYNEDLNNPGKSISNSYKRKI